MTTTKLALLCFLGDETDPAGVGFVSVYIKRGKNYEQVEIPSDGSAPVVTESAPVSQFKNYAHFVGVMGKFNPWYQFKATPMELDSLDYGYLRALIDAFGWKPEIAV